MALPAEQRNYARLAAARRRGPAEDAAGQAGAQAGATGGRAVGRGGGAAGGAGGAIGGAVAGGVAGSAGRAVDRQAELALRQNQERRNQDQDKTMGDRLRAEAAKRLTQAALVYSGVGAPLAKFGGKVAGKIGGSKTGRHIFYAGLIWIGVQMMFFLSLLFVPLLLMCFFADQAIPAGGGFLGGLAKGIVSGATGFGGAKGFVCQ